jgi:NADH:ubiquinone oxidoreductase subunit 6 (subunit J)
MKTATVVIGASTILTLAFYVAAYYFLPGGSPSAPLVMLFAGAAIVIVVSLKYLCQKLDKKLRAKVRAKVDTTTVIAGVTAFVFVSAVTIGLIVLPLFAPESSPNPRPDNSTELSSRVTGNEILKEGAIERSGYGLYSYALLSHAPSEADAPKYRSFLTALLQLPSARGEEKYIGRERINITYLLLKTYPEDWNLLHIESKVDYAILHYDYERAAVIIASIPGRHGTGPLITSALSPITGNVEPRPILIQDLSKAQPALMAAYVSKFVAQAKQPNFWEEDALATFAVDLRNVLETAANGVGMSKDAVASWIHFSK